MRKFWTNSSGSFRFDPEALHNFLKEDGYGVLMTGDLNSAIFVKVEGRIIKTVSNREVRSHCWKYINELYQFQSPEERNQVINAFHRERILFSNDNLLLLPQVTVNEIKDTAECSFMFFKNCILKITSDGIKKIKYEEIDGHVFEKEIIDFNLTCDNVERNDGTFFSFMRHICNNDDPGIMEKNSESLMSIVGYLLHRFKDPANAKAVVFMDPFRGEGANGGTGKSLFTKAFEKVRPCVYEDGKFFNSKDKFALSQVEYNTRILVLDDISENFDFSKLFPLITEKAVIERKYENKYTILFDRSPKIVITTNYTLNASDESSRRRKIEFVLSDFFSTELTPEDFYCHLLFLEWDQQDWEDFYLLMAYCIWYYLMCGIIKPQINVAERTLKMQAHPFFIEYGNGYILPNVKYDKKKVYDDYYTKNPGVAKVELTTFRRWLKLYADAYGFKFTETHSGNDNFFEYSLQ